VKSRRVSFIGSRAAPPIKHGRRCNVLCNILDPRYYRLPACCTHEERRQQQQVRSLCGHIAHSTTRTMARGKIVGKAKKAGVPSGNDGPGPQPTCSFLLNIGKANHARAGILTRAQHYLTFAFCLFAPATGLRVSSRLPFVQCRIWWGCMRRALTGASGVWHQLPYSPTHSITRRILTHMICSPSHFIRPLREILKIGWK
jgi:hypothetical protein